MSTSSSNHRLLGTWRSHRELLKHSLRQERGRQVAWSSGGIKSYATVDGEADVLSCQLPVILQRHQQSALAVLAEPQTKVSHHSTTSNTTDSVDTHSFFSKSVQPTSRCALFNERGAVDYEYTRTNKQQLSIFEFDGRHRKVDISDLDNTSITSASLHIA